MRENEERATGSHVKRFPGPKNVYDFVRESARLPGIGQRMTQLVDVGLQRNEKGELKYTRFEMTDMIYGNHLRNAKSSFASSMRSIQRILDSEPTTRPTKLLRNKIVDMIEADSEIAPLLSYPALLVKVLRRDLTPKEGLEQLATQRDKLEEEKLKKNPRAGVTREYDPVRGVFITVFPSPPVAKAIPFRDPRIDPKHQHGQRETSETIPTYVAGRSLELSSPNPRVVMPEGDPSDRVIHRGRRRRLSRGPNNRSFEAGNKLRRKS